MKKLFLLTVLLATAAGASTTQAASFNCRYAKLPVEVAICQNDNLHVLDERMARKYFQLRDRLPGHLWREVRGEQKSWIRRRNRCGYDNYCITGRYTSRIRQLNRWLQDF